MKSDIDRICPTPPADKPWVDERIQQLSDQLAEWKECAHDLAVYGMSNSWQSLEWQEAMTRYVKLREGDQ